MPKGVRVFVQALDVERVPGGGTTSSRFSGDHGPARSTRSSAIEGGQNLLEFHPHLANELPALVDFSPRLFSRELLSAPRMVKPCS